MRFQKGNQYGKGHGRPKGSFRSFVLEQSKEDWPIIVERWLTKLKNTNDFSELLDAIKYLGPPTKLETEDTSSSLPKWAESLHHLPLEAWVQIQAICQKYDESSDAPA